MATRVEEAEIFAAADAVLARGERPTTERVRAQLGRGSPNRVGPALEQWWEALAKRLAGEMRLPELPPDVATAFRSVWSTAVGLAEQTINVQMDEQRQQVAQTYADLVAERSRWVAELETARQQIEAARQAQSVAETRLADAQQTSERQAQQWADGVRQREVLQARLDQAAEEAATLRSQLELREAAAASEREALNRHVRGLEDRSHAEIDRARQETRELRAQHSALEREHGLRERQRDEARTALSTAQREAAGHRSRAEALEKQLVRLGDLHASLQSSLAQPTGTHPSKRSGPRKKTARVAAKVRAKPPAPKLPAAR